MFILESESGKPFKIKGIAMRKDVTSKNGFHYSSKIVEKTVKTIQEAIKQNGSYPISMMADHPTAVTNKVLSVIGRITDIYMDGNNALIEAEVANTTVGKDVQELIKGKFVEGLSIRASNAKYEKKYLGTSLVKDVLEMDLKGVDLVVNPGVDGARIIDIIESDQTDSYNSFIEVTESEEVKISPQGNIDEEEDKLDIKELKEKFPELVESLKAEMKQIFESENKLSELQESFDEVTKVKTDLETKVTESEKTISDLQESEASLKAKLEEAEGKLATIEEETASATRKAHVDTKLAELKFADSVKDALRKKVEVLESTEEIDKVLESEVEFLNIAIKSATGVEVKHKGKTGENEDKKSGKIAEEEDFINKVLGM
jgi:hypothetical protein